MEPTNFSTAEFPREEPQILLTPQALYYLKHAGKWARFLGILGFITTAFIFIAALFVGTIFSMVSQLNPAAAAIPTAGLGGVLSFIYILVAIFYLFLSLYIYRFGARVKKGLLFNDGELIASGLGNLKSHFKLIGITAIVIISLYILAFAFVMILGVGAAALTGR